jgi:hypothetical protein
MSIYKVITPLARVDPQNGFQTFTTGDMIEIKDEAEAARMIAAGIVAPGSSPKVERAEQIETADAPPLEAEKAVKRGKKEK